MKDIFHQYSSSIFVYFDCSSYFSHLYIICTKDILHQRVEVFLYIFIALSYFSHFCPCCPIVLNKRFHLANFCSIAHTVLFSAAMLSAAT